MEKEEKISVSDLSVGDWVQDILGNICIVRNIFCGDLVECYVVEKGDELGIMIDRLRPIPITAEVLEKNGFVDNGVGQHYLKCGNSITVRVGRSPLFHDGCWLVATDKQVDETISTTCVLFNARHIHDMQRVMRLAKVEREIVL